MNPYAGAQRMFPLAPIRDAVERAVSTESLKGLALNATDPDLLLGLALLAQVGNPIRKEFAASLIQRRLEYAPIAALLPLVLDGVEETAVLELIRCDATNALGYYLQGHLLYQRDCKREALESFRKAGACHELCLYDTITAEGLFKTIDALNLKGEDRLCALSWMSSRMYNFSSSALQPLRNSLWELATGAELDVRKEVSDLLLVLAGHLFSTNYVNRWFGERAVESALHLKAEIGAAENSPTMYGYGAATQISAHSIETWPGLEDVPKPYQLAHFLPSYIFRAFAIVDPEKFNPKYVGELNFKVSDSNRAAFEQAKTNLITAARALLDVALADPDVIMGAYLRGVPAERDGKHPWFPPGTLVGKLTREKPELLRAAAAYQAAMTALWKVGDSDPERRNIVRLMNIGWALQRYASQHENTYPATLDLLFEEGRFEPSIESKSLLTGRPYVFLAAGQKRPEKAADLFDLVLLYDDRLIESGYHPCVLANCAGSHVRPATIEQQIRSCKAKLV